MARLKWQSNQEFGGREKELERLMKQLRSVKQNFEHCDSGDEIKRLEKKDQ